MDPASAAVAFVGFSASIATLLAVAITSCEKIQSMAHALKHAPEHIRRLFSKIERLQKIVAEIEKMGKEMGEESLDLDIQNDWAEVAKMMKTDLLALEKKISKLQRNLDGKTSSRVHMSVRVRMFFSAEEVDRYEKLWADHLDTIGIWLNILSNTRSRIMLKELKSRSSDISRLVASANSLPSLLRSELKDVHMPIEEPLGSLSHAFSRQIQTIPMDGCNSRQKSALTLLQSLPLNQDTLSIVRQPEKVTEVHPRSKSLCDTAFRSPEQCFDVSKNSVYPKESIYYEDVAPSQANSRRLHIPRRAAKSITEHWTLSIYKFTVGTITIRRVSRREEQEVYGEQEYHTSSMVTFSLHPAPWIANKIIELDFTLRSSQRDSPSVSSALRSRCYNHNPLLVSYLHEGNITGLKNLFMKGIARPTDILAPWGNSLLHEAVYNSLSAESDSTELCKFLIEQGADLDVRSLNGNTPLHLCCELMGLTNNLEQQLEPMASLLIKAGSDLTLCNSSGYSACSLIFQSQNGLEYLQSFMFSYLDIFTLQQLEGVDLWTLAALARAFPSFYQRLQAQLLGFHTPAELSPPRKAITPAIELDISLQVAEVKATDSVVRQSFLRLLCAKGTLEMVKPFLDCGINLDEHSPNDDKTYIRAAAKSGKVDVVAALAQAGASLDTYDPLLSESELLPAFNAIDDLLERWYSIQFGRPEYQGCPETEHWIFRELLKNPTCKATDSIFFALGRLEDPFIFRCLLEAGYGRREGMQPNTRAPKALGSEVIWAIKTNTPMAGLLVQHGLDIECEDSLGFSALLHALDRGKGRIDFTRLLIRAGADLTRRTASGFTPLEFAKRNINAQHPRYPRRDGLNRDWDFHAVTLQEDREAYEYLKQAIREKDPSTQGAWSNSNFQYAMSRALDLQQMLASNWRLFRQTAFTVDDALACVGLVLTFSAFLLLTAWDCLWWIVKMRKSRFPYQMHILLLSGTLIWLAFGVIGLPSV